MVKIVAETHLIRAPNLSCALSSTGDLVESLSLFCFSRHEDIFRLKVTVDIMSEKPITGVELNRIFENTIDTKQRFDDLTVRKDEFYKLIVVEGKHRTLIFTALSALNLKNYFTVLP